MGVSQEGRCQRLVASELRRLGAKRIGIHDEDDLRQELLWAALRASARVVPARGSGTAYIRESVRNAIKKLYRATYAQSRCPSDSHGVAIPLVYGTEPVEPVDPDRRALLALGARLVRSRLCPESQETLDGMLAGRIVSRNRIDVLCEEIQGGDMTPDPYAIPNPPADDTPDCHADGVSPEGYDPKESMCQDCQDKFTCLPRASERKLIAHSVEIDVEVSSVIAKSLLYQDALKQIMRRDTLRKSGKPVPVELWPIAPNKTAAEAAPKRKLVRKAAAPPVAATPPPAAPAVVEPPAPSIPALPRAAKAKALKMPKERPPRPERKTPIRPLRDPKPIPKEEMQAAMARVRLGKPIDFEIGYQIVKHSANGEEHVVTLRENGFEYKGNLYNSLTQCAGHASGNTYRAGNDWFSLVTSRRTEVRDAKGKVIARGGA